MHVHVHIIYISVIMILQFAESSEMNGIQDFNEWCLQGRMNFVYLTSGGQVSDKSVAMIAKEKNFHCSLTYVVKPKQNLMLVLEFPDQKSNEGVCISDENTSVTVSNCKSKETCQCNVSSGIYSKLSPENISLIIRNEDEMSTIKITATSMRDPQSAECFKSNETECVVGKKIFCMTDKVACDGHNNCGVPNFYDENEEKCGGQKLTSVMILFSLVMVVITILLLLSFGVTFLPKRKEVFVYKFDQTISLFDSEGGIINVEIEIDVLFPEKSKEP